MEIPTLETEKNTYVHIYLKSAPDYEDSRVEFKLPSFKVDEVEGKVLLACINYWILVKYVFTMPEDFKLSFEWVKPDELASKCPLQ